MCAADATNAIAEGSYNLEVMVIYISHPISWLQIIQIIQSVYIVVYGNCGEKKKGGKKKSHIFFVCNRIPNQAFPGKKKRKLKIDVQKKKHETGRSQNIPPTGSFIKRIEALKQRTLIMSPIQTTTGKKQLYPNGSDPKASL